MKRNPPRSFPNANWNACRSNKYTHSSKQSRSQWKISISIIGLHTVIHECDVSELLTNWNWYLRWYLTSLFTLEIWKINIIVSGRTYGGIEFHEWARFSSLSISYRTFSFSLCAHGRPLRCLRLWYRRQCRVLKYLLATGIKLLLYSSIRRSRSGVTFVIRALYLKLSALRFPESIWFLSIRRAHFASKQPWFAWRSVNNAELCVRNS